MGRVPNNVMGASSISSGMHDVFRSPRAPVCRIRINFGCVTSVVAARSVTFNNRRDKKFNCNVRVPRQSNVFSSLLLLRVLSTSPCYGLSSCLRRGRRGVKIVYCSHVSVICARPSGGRLLP